jgi:transcriptional regulator with AAA-type ATPase domain/NAD-dependent dihydropyrimidine dehydrogenase PreA subunit
MSHSGWVTWLQERTALNVLSLTILEAIAQHLQSLTLPPQHTVVQEETLPDGLYILRSGHLESAAYRWRSISLLPGSVINLQELLLNQPVQQTLTTLNECKFYFIPADAFQALVEQYPEINQAFSQQLAETVEALSDQLSYEQERMTLLQPYLIPKVKRGVVGKSRYGVKLRSQIINAAKDRESVLIFGEPGLEKDNLAALIHFSSPDRRKPLIQMDCGQLQTKATELWGRVGGKPGLLEALEDGTLILNNLEDLADELIPQIVNLVENHTYYPVNRGENANPQPRVTSARILMISEKVIPPLDHKVNHLIKVPPLRVRKADIEDYVKYYISLICRNQCIQKPQITPEALRRLQAYDFPNNLQELENLIERALVQLQGCSDITEEIIWPSQSKKKQFRWNLLNAYPSLRQFLRSPWWPDWINYGFVLTTFAIIVTVLFVGSQTRSENFALNLFWAWWWPIILIIFPFLGRIWCAVCPFMIYGEVTQKLSLWLFPRTLKRWPRQTAEKWGGWFLWGLFALILLWEELWDLKNTAYLSACLLLLITAGAIICSAIFERRFWCRYLCPIGGMNGMFAKLSMTELRAQQGTCSAECTTYQCYKGGPQKGEGLETNGCPLYSHPAQLNDNRDCVLCMTCLKACPHRSVEVNLRPPAIELWTTHTPRTYEVALLFLLLNLVFLHRLPNILSQLHLDFNLGNFWSHSLLAIAALSLPTVIPIMAYGMIRLVHQLKTRFKPRSFVELAYGYLPLVLAGNLAHYLNLGLGEAGKILPVTWATFGLNGTGLPTLIAHPAVIAFLQGTTLIAGFLTAVIVTQKIARQPFSLLLPHHLSMILITGCWWTIIVGH